MWAAIVVVLAVAACSGSPSPGGSPTASPPSPIASAPPSVNLPAAVVVTADKERYSPGEVVTVEVRNGLREPITAIDQQAFCTVLRIDRASGGGWEELRNCMTGPPPKDVVIGAGENQIVRIEQGLEAGEYRIRLVYTPGSRFVVGDALEAVAGPITVG